MLGFALLLPSSIDCDDELVFFYFLHDVLFLSSSYEYQKQVWYRAVLMVVVVCYCSYYYFHVCLFVRNCFPLSPRELGETCF
jgi:hypothetical protein